MTTKTDTVLNTIASRVGLIAALGCLVAICLGAGHYIQSVVVQLEKNHAVFKDTQLRNGYVGMSDVQRLTLIVQRAVVLGEMTAEMKSDFKEATDVLYVRTDNFEIQMAKSDGLETGLNSIAALWRIVELADDALEQDFPDIPNLALVLLEAAAEARMHMVQFLDDTRRKADLVLETQSQAVKNQQVFVLLALVGLAHFGAAALLFLRREVIGRQAREKAERRVEFLAFFDPLTELPNRVQFQDKLQDMLDKNTDLALLFVDLDDFKLVNDTHGHAAGDAVLKCNARKLERIATDNGGFAARLGGDEFAVVLPGGDVARMKSICATLVEKALGSVDFEGRINQGTVSIGLSVTSQIRSPNGTSVDELSRLTDFALYEAKAAGRNCYKMYDQELEFRYLERRQMIEELPTAVQCGGLEVHLQPKVTLATQEVFGFEALVRWKRDGRLIPPDKFILLAEESGFVLDIDNFVLNEAAKIIADWNLKNHTHYSISVNLSALHLNSEHVVENVQDALWQSKLSPGLLTLEITESMEVRDWKQAQRIIAMLHGLGCKIAIDDFGTGYSSLAYLRTTVADELKIDRSLVAEIELSQRARMLLTSVVEIARNLDLEVTVEGIETEAQAVAALDMGVHQAQGYLFGRPGPAEKILAGVLGTPSINAQVS